MQSLTFGAFSGRSVASTLSKPAIRFLHGRSDFIALHNWQANAYMKGTELMARQSDGHPPPEETTMYILRKARNWMRSRQTATELANLSNETLADIGLSRFDIDTVARGLRR